MKKKCNLIFLMLVSLVLSGCQTVQETKVESKPDLSSTPAPIASVSPKVSQTTVDVPKLVNKSAAELDKIFGSPEKISAATISSEKPGEYRLYKSAGHPKGLSVRFYKDKAVRFNLILGTAEKFSREALLKYFNIDTAKMTSIKGESLSETWKGTAGGVNFATVYAKREKADSDFVMIHAEIAQ